MPRSKRTVARLYEATSAGYDEVYGEEQRAKHSVALELLQPSYPALDAGCGTGLLMAKLGRLSVGLDISLSMLERARQRSRGELVLGDVEQLPFRGGSFRSAYSITVLQLAEDLASAMGELARVLKGGGRAIVSAHRSTAASAGLARAAERAGLKVLSAVEPSGPLVDLMLLCEKPSGPATRLVS